MKISSPSNPKIKNLLKIQQKSKERISLNLSIIEGVKEIQMALQGGHIVKEVFLCKEIFSAKNIFPPRTQITEISTKVFKKLAYRKTTGGIIALCRPERLHLEKLKLPDRPLLLILDNIEKPGNLGAILRTAEAAGVDAVILSDPKTDLSNPNVIRSSMGTIFTMTIIMETAEKTISWLKKNNIRILATALDKNTKDLYRTDIKTAAAIVMGTEDLGLPDHWLKAADEKIQIPMRGKIDSLNLSNATSVIIFEALRQRYHKFPTP
ncbi:MAG: TrmH family RNA methyltransferase [Flavobacteriales bacterium Tduv]